MKKTINVYDFIREFETMGRETNFSRAGLVNLFTYIEMVEDQEGEEWELDVIDLCCNYTEYDLAEFKADYPDFYQRILYDYAYNNTWLDLDKMNDAQIIDFVEKELPIDDLMNSLETEIRNETEFIKVTDNSFIIRNF